MAKSALSAPFFHDEKAAYAKLESLLWPHGPVCPRCGGLDRITAVKGKTARNGLYRCGPCKRQFTVTVGTLFERSHIPLHQWLQAAHLLCSSKKGMSSHQIHRILGVTYKTAWFLTHRLREAMREGKFPSALGGEGKFVEADTTYIGGKEKNKHVGKRDAKKIGGMGKEIVHALVERGGRVRSDHIANITGETLRPILFTHVDPKSALMTDTAGGYMKIGKAFARHEMVDHGALEYVRGDAHSNTVENYFSILKRGITGTYHHVSKQHLKRYLAEFDFRHNERSALGVSDEARTALALRGIVGKRLTYRDSSV